MCGVIGTLFYIPMNFVSIKLYNTLPRHQVLRIGMAIQLIFAMLRFVGIYEHKFRWIFIGSLG